MTAHALPALYVRPLKCAGSIPFVFHNRYARYAFLIALRHLERRLGTPRQPRWVTLPSGARFPCDLADNLQAELYYLRSYSSAEIHLLRNHLRPGEVFLDVGAHIGLFAVEIAKHLGDHGRVIAFEPSPDVAKRLRRNVAVNDLDSAVSVYEIALGDRCERRSFYSSSRRPTDVGMRSFFGDGTPVAEVSVRTLDELVDAGAVGPIDAVQAVKIDVEGAEALVLDGMQRTLASCRPRLVLVETVATLLNRAGSSVADVERRMEELGYAVLPGVTKRNRNTAFVPAERAR